MISDDVIVVICVYVFDVVGPFDDEVVDVDVANRSSW